MKKPAKQPTDRWKAEGETIWHLETKEPRRFRVSVHRLHGIEDVWFLSSVPDFFMNLELQSKTIDEAKAEALQKVQATLSAVLDWLTG